MMDKIRKNIYLGSERDLTLSNLKKNKIDAILNVAEEAPLYKKDGIESYKVQMKDSSVSAKSKTKEAVDKLIDMLNRHKTVFVHCKQGRSRSPHVIAKTLAKLENADYNKIYSEIRNIRPEVMKYSLEEEITSRL